MAGRRPSWPRLRAVGLALAAFALLGATSRAGAEALRPAILYNLVKFDASFNEGAYRGVERFKSETGTTYREFEVKSDVEREEVLRRFAGRGEDPIIAIGFPFASAIAPRSRAIIPRRASSSSTLWSMRRMCNPSSSRSRRAGISSG